MGCCVEVTSCQWFEVKNEENCTFLALLVLNILLTLRLTNPPPSPIREGCFEEDPSNLKLFYLCFSTLNSKDVLSRSSTATDTLLLATVTLRGMKVLLKLGKRFSVDKAKLRRF